MRFNIAATLALTMASVSAFAAAEGTQASRTESKEQAQKPKLRSNSKNNVNKNAIETHIVGGSQSDVGDFPYYVDMQGCGGTLIAPDVVLGAAHCGGYKGDTVYVSGYRYGSEQNGAQGVKVVRQSKHPDYDSQTMENDFFLYKLEREVYPVHDDVTLTVNDQGSVPSNGQMLTVMGLGTLSSGGDSPNRLHDVQVPTVSNSYCESNGSYGNEFDRDTMLCAGDTQNGDKDSCQGDSGGPLVIANGNNHVLVGVVSWGYGCGEAEYPGVYARVSSAMDWIESVVCTQWESNADFCGGSSGGGDDGGDDSDNGNDGGDSGGDDSDGDSSSCTNLRMIFKTDKWPEETTFYLREDDGTYIWDERNSNFDPRTRYVYNACVPTNGCTTLEFMDSWGDGLLNDGFLKVKYDGSVIYNDWDFGSGETFRLGSGC